MAIDRRTSKQESAAIARATGEGQSLAATLPRLILDARRVASTVIHGLHGRRRAGPGENFWQYRRFVSGEPAGKVDWRRSGRDDNLYVREREWEAAHTIWIWPDRSPSMTFRSAQSNDSKLDRALVVAFAMAEILVSGGERVGLPALMRPTGSRAVIEKMAQLILHDRADRTSLPQGFAPSAHSEMIVISDLWSPIADIRAMIGQLAAAGTHGHVVQVVDPAEETFPYSGRVEFVDPEGGGAITAGRAETWRADYTARIARHRAEIRAETDRLGWSFIIHRTDRPASELVLALHARMGADLGGLRDAPGERGMMPFLPLGFAEPLALLGLISIPILWWLLRLIPPRPRQIDFPPTRLLFDIPPKEETPSRTPWWLTLLRLVLAALVIIAAAGPLWNPPLATTAARTPILLLIDDGLPAAGTWEMRLRTADEILARADTDGRGVAIATTSEPARDISLQPAGAARARVAQLKPKPFFVDRAEMMPALGRFLGATPDIELVWLSDGVDFGKSADFVTALGKLVNGKPITVVEGGVPPARALAGAENAAGALAVKVLRSNTGGSDTGVVRALDLKGLPLGDAPFTFVATKLETDAQLTMPVEIRNDVARLEILGERSAGAVQLLDKSWRRRSVGVVSGNTADTAQPLLAGTFYLSRALAPFADVRLADRTSPSQAVAQFLDQRVSMMVLADVGNIPGEAHDRLAQWVNDGGVLVRFAGPRLAAGDDDLVPVKLRRGGRILGGSLSWEQPQQLAGFSRDGPFNGMAIPGDVTVTRQVLAEPDVTLNERAWATLADGTPLVTAQRYSKGMIVLFHVTADTRWSDLPLSGAFAEMLKRVLALSGQSTGDSDATVRGNERDVVAPSRVLDGFGVFTAPTDIARPVPAGFNGRASADHPPGFYGPAEGLLAVNALTPSDRLAALDTSALRATRDVYRQAEPRDLRGPILTVAFLMLALDGLIVFWLAGGIGRLMRRRGPATAAMFALALLGAALLWPQAGYAQSADDFAMKATTGTHLAYVITGDAEVDNISRTGLRGLMTFLAQRTALESGEPMALDPGRDELSFFPLIYWPVLPTATKPSPQTLQRVDAYMKQGGTVLFDTRDAVEAVPGSDTRGPGMRALREILSSLDIPELEPLPRDHVLAKTFYLMRDFPGRFNTGQLWVEALPAANDDGEARPARAGDGVSSILITSNDLAGAWALRPDGQPMLPLVAAEPRQREFALRGGVNIVMYALTGNYKADLVHMPALLERLGQ